MATSPFKTAAHAQESGEVQIALLTITHPASAEVAYVSSDPTIRLSEDPLRYGTVSRGNEYIFIPFGPPIPDAQEAAPPQARLVIDNVDQELIALVRSHHEPATILIEIVLASSPDTVEYAYAPLEVIEAQYDAQQLTLELRYPSLAEEAYPTGSFTPSAFPGLFP